MVVFVNDKSVDAAEGTPLAQLLDRLDLPSRHFAVEIDQNLVPRKEHASYLLRDGDRIEVVTLVGGG